MRGGWQLASLRANGRSAMARILAVDPVRPQPAVVAEAVRILRAGGLVAFPTETVYGLGASALDEGAVRRVFAAKGRPLGHPLIAHVEGEERARSLARAWPEMASRLARAFWPGPLTLVVDRAMHVPEVVSGGGESIAVRVPAHPVALAIIEGLGGPVAAPSANRHQEISPTLAAHVVAQLGEYVDLVLDAGPCATGIESTVLDVRGNAARVLRPGAASVRALREIVGDLEVLDENAMEGVGRASPGMGARHYAPQARLRIVETMADARSTVQDLSAEGRRAGVIACEDPTALAWPEGTVVRVLGSAPEGYARLLYATLHDLDEAGVRAIVVVRVPRDEAWSAIADRLRRAAH
jgi:L-threonylcarbamoyladenylate synthase